MNTNSIVSGDSWTFDSRVNTIRRLKPTRKEKRFPTTRANSGDENMGPTLKLAPKNKPTIAPYTNLSIFVGGVVIGSVNIMVPK